MFMFMLSRVFWKFANCHLYQHMTTIGQCKKYVYIFFLFINSVLTPSHTYLHQQFCNWQFSFFCLDSTGRHSTSSHLLCREEFIPSYSFSSCEYIYIFSCVCIYIYKHTRAYITFLKKFVWLNFYKPEFACMHLNFPCTLIVRYPFYL